MSRIGRKPIAVPAGVEVSIDGSTVTAKGPQGTLTGTFNSKMNIALDAGHITVTRPDDTSANKALHGLTRTLVSNMVEGVAHGFKKELEINGIGYRAELKGSEGILVASKIADRVGITRSVIVNALRKLESAGVIESRSSGMRGTYIKVLNESVFTELESMKKKKQEKA